MKTKNVTAQTTQPSSGGSSARAAKPTQAPPTTLIKQIMDDCSPLKGHGARAKQEGHQGLLQDLLSSATAAPSSPLPQRYVGSVKLQAVPGKGRGMFATRDIAAGELLVASKPLYAVAVSEAHTVWQRILFTRMTKSDMQLLEAMYDGTEQSTALLPELHTLPDSEPRKECLMASWVCAQPTTPPQLHGTIKALLNTADVSLRVTDQGKNTCSLKLEGLIAAQDKLLQNAAPQAMVAAAASCVDAFARDASFRLQVEKIATKRALNGWVLGDTVLSKVQPIQNPAELLAALDAAMSYINHSCAPNAGIVLFNGMCIARAARDIACGAEITNSYLRSMMPLQRRREFLQHHFRFTCQCSRCVAEEQLDAEAKSAIQAAIAAVQGTPRPQKDSSSMQPQTDIDCRAVRSECERLLGVAKSRKPEQGLLVTASAHPVLKIYYLFQLQTSQVWDVRVLRTYISTLHSLAPTSTERIAAAAEFYDKALQIYQTQKCTQAKPYLDEARQALQDALDWRYGKGHDAAFAARLFDTALATAQFSKGNDFILC